MLDIDFLTNGTDQLAKYPEFKLIGRDDVVRKLSSILMRKRANSIFIYGPGGVGCTAVILGLQDLKNIPNSPFDIVNKTFFFLDTDNLFSSGNSEAINTNFQKMIHLLNNTSDSVLVINDVKDFFEACQRTNCMHFINSLLLTIRNNKTQAIVEGRDNDLEYIIKLCPDVLEFFTVIDLEEPINDALVSIVNDSARKLEKFHGIKVTDDAVMASIELTNKYRTKDFGLSRAQPERAVTLLDRGLSSYRLIAHQTTPKGMSDSEWNDKQNQIKEFNAKRKSAENSLLEEQDNLSKQLKKESENSNTNKSEIVGKFQHNAKMAGYRSAIVKEIDKRIEDYKTAVNLNKANFDKLAAEINSHLVFDRDKVYTEFSSISGISVSKLNENEVEKLVTLENKLNKRIFGQTHVTKQVADGIRVAKIGRRNKEKPLASYLFSGPSGVGKTELAKALSEAILDDEKALTRFDMSEYMEKHAVAKLIGAPPGYEGFEAGGILTNAMRKNPSRVLLFDEIEKAHPDVFNVFLQILDDGRLTDNVGRVVSFSSAIIIMTTNLGQPHFLRTDINFEEAKLLAMDDICGTYRGEFLNRFNGRQNIICFNRLGIPDIEKIVLREIANINAAYQDRNIKVRISESDVSKFCNEKYDPTSGARGLPGYIQVTIEPVIVDQLLKDQNSVGTFNVTYDGKFNVEFISERNT